MSRIAGHFMIVKKAKEITFQDVKLKKVVDKFIGVDEGEPAGTRWRRRIEISLVENKTKEAGVEPKFLRLVERYKEAGGEITRTFDMRIESKNGTLKPYCFYWEGSDITHAVDIEKSVGKLLQNPVISRWVGSHLAESGKAEIFKGLRQD
ncbi:MAG: hypothetical protein NTY73_04035 [Candidatus Micrarchaeota archaeon]|nr:hypothetical protein [Candidatus Micrarchaeota archaeon]